MSNKTSYL